MSEILFEQHLVQNPALGAEAILVATQEINKISGREAGFPFLLSFIILPIAFHRASAQVLATKTRPGALHKALRENREITIGLQERMEALSEKTMKSVSLGFASGLLLYDPADSPSLFPGRKSSPVEHVTEEVKTILAASKRIGQAVYEMPEAQIASTLNIRF